MTPDQADAHRSLAPILWRLADAIEQGSPAADQIDRLASVLRRIADQFAEYWGPPVPVVVGLPAPMGNGLSKTEP
jgi:hypothetical protein